MGDEKVFVSLDIGERQCINDEVECLPWDVGGFSVGHE